VSPPEELRGETAATAVDSVWVVLSSPVEEAVVARLVMVAGILALAAVLSAGCGGGGGDHAKVEASLHRYLVSLVPGDAPFPVGAGTPRVRENSCKDRHVKIEKALAWPGVQGRFRQPLGLALWQCVVKFGTLATPVLVAVDDSTEVVAAAPGGTLKEAKPK
jgi:hypothetical protein